MSRASTVSPVRTATRPDEKLVLDSLLNIKQPKYYFMSIIVLARFLGYYIAANPGYDIYSELVYVGNDDVDEV